MAGPMYVVILAGGGGTRLWPVSRPERPKPYLPLVDDESLLQRTVQRIAGALGLAIAELFVEEPSRSQVVARAERRRIEYPGLGSVDEFLTDGLSGRLQVIISTIAPGGGTGQEAYAHDSDEEVVVVLEGSIELWVGDDHHVLETGDAITYSSRVPHWNLDNGTVPAVVLFCVTPPSF